MGLQKVLFIIHLSHLYRTTGKTIALTILIFVNKVMSQLFNTLSRFVIAILPRSKCHLISWLQSLPTLILEPNKWNLTVSTFFLSICHEVIGTDAIILVFWMLSFKPTFSLSTFTSSRGSLAPLHFLPLQWYNLHTWGCYVSRQSLFQLVIHPAQHFVWFILHKVGWRYTAWMYSFLNLEPVCCSISSSIYCFLSCIQVS